MDVTLTIGTTKTDTQAITPTEQFEALVKLALGAADVSLTLGTLAAPKMIAVFGAEGVSFKIGAGGTDSIKADPFAIIFDENGDIGETAILLSNSDSVEHDVYVYAYEY